MPRFSSSFKTTGDHWLNRSEVSNGVRMSINTLMSFMTTGSAEGPDRHQHGHEDRPDGGVGPQTSLRCQNFRLGLLIWYLLEMFLDFFLDLVHHIWVTLTSKGDRSISSKDLVWTISGLLLTLNSEVHFFICRVSLFWDLNSLSRRIVARLVTTWLSSSFSLALILSYCIADGFWGFTVSSWNRWAAGWRMWHNRNNTFAHIVWDIDSWYRQLVEQYFCPIHSLR